MTAHERPRVIKGGRLDAPSDTRVDAVLAVLGGEAAGDVAKQYAVEVALLRRWVRDFVSAGTAQVTNRPMDDLARERDRFLSTFMHGVRTTLASAQGWVGLLHDLPEDPGATLAIVERIQAALNELDESAGEVEMLTAAMLGRLPLAPTGHRVAELVAHALPEQAAADDDTAVTADLESFTHALKDLWATASSMAPLPESVRLEVATMAPWVEFAVVRRGRPIDPRALQALFEPFDVGEGHGRTGIGLYLVRALIVLNRDTVGVEQDDDATRFWIRVPHLSAEPEEDHDS